jgi:hypothetical protein
MKRKLIQIVLIASMLCGAMSQALACVSLQQDAHSCCRMLSPGQASKARLAAKTHQKSTALPPCCAVSVPHAPQQAPVKNREPQPNVYVQTFDDQTRATCFLANLTFTPKRLCEPVDDSPPSFILHQALLI